MLNRRDFIRLSLTSGALTLIGGAFSGCSQNINKVSKAEVIDRESNLISAIDYTQMSFKDSIRYMEGVNLTRKDYKKYSFDLEFSLPWFIGPRVDMDKDNYFVRRYSNEDLLFTDFGIGNRLYFDYRYKYKELGLEKKFTVDQKAISLGYDSLEDMYISIFIILTTYQPKETYVFLKKYADMGLIDLDSILNISNIKKDTEKLIRKYYNSYYSFEDNAKDNGIKSNLDNTLYNWFVIIDNKEIKLKKEDYYIYALTDKIVTNILINSHKGQIINV